jgi:hypothetical protein
MERQLPTGEGGGDILRWSGAGRMLGKWRKMCWTGGSAWLHREGVIQARVLQPERFACGRMVHGPVNLWVAL